MFHVCAGTRTSRETVSPVSRVRGPFQGFVYGAPRATRTRCCSGGVRKKLNGRTRAAPVNPKPGSYIPPDNARRLDGGVVFSEDASQQRKKKTSKGLSAPAYIHYSTGLTPNKNRGRGDGTTPISVRNEDSLM
jgi:hypothetical protein